MASFNHTMFKNLRVCFLFQTDKKTI